MLTISVTTRAWEIFFVLASFLYLDVESKRSAVEWAGQALDPAWGELIRKAWTERTEVRYGQKVGQPAETQLVRETVRFLAYARTDRK